MSYDCELCGYTQFQYQYECVKRQRYEEHLKSHNHQLKILLNETNAASTIKKCKDIVKLGKEDGCAICNYMPSERSNYRFSMNRHILSNGHIIKATAHNIKSNDGYIEKLIKQKHIVEANLITKKDFVPNILISRPSNISLYKQQLIKLENDGKDDEALLLRQKIQAIENSKSIFAFSKSDTTEGAYGKTIQV